MKNFLIRLVAIALLAGFFNACNETLVEEPVTDDLELKSAQNGLQSYIVVLNDTELDAELSNLKGYEKRKDAAQKAASKVLNRAGIADGQIGHAYGTAIKGFSVKIPPGQLKKLENDPAVKYIEEDQIVTLIQPLSVNINSDITASAQVTPWGIARVNGGADGTGKTAWVIDTGTDINHPDLIVDTYKDWDFVNGDDNADDDNGHGTHCAGIIGAIDNDEGVIGVAAGATIVPVKVLDANGSGYLSDVVAGVDYVGAYAKAGDVANMSLGGGAYTALDDAVKAVAGEGIKFAIAAGNDGSDASNYSPARVNGPNIFTIAAFAEGDVWASYSNYGSPVDFCEPGSSIYSTYINTDGYATLSGTSMAAPHMAGILLLGDVASDGVVSTPRIRGKFYEYPIGVVGGGSSNTSPTASFSYSTTDLAVDFTDVSSDSDGSIASWNWNFGDGSTSTTQNPSHNYASSGTYGVTLTVTDDDGATGTVSKNVTVSNSSTNEAPVITSFSLINTSNPAMKRVQVNWSVTDSDGDLKTVETQLTGPGTASAITNVSGSSASGVHELSVKKGSSGLYTVTIIVTDVAGNTTTDSQNITL